MAQEDAVTVGNAPAPLPASKLPAPTRFPLLTVLSLALSTLLFSFVADSTGVELASISRSLNEPWQAGVVLGWKVIELGVAWYLNYDDIDTVSFTTLSHLPFCYLLWSFYSVSLRATTTLLLIDIVSTALPVTLLRPRALEHRQPRSPATTTTTTLPDAANPHLLHDRFLQALNVVLAAATYSAALVLAHRTFLPTTLILHFDALRSLDRAHATGMRSLLPFLLPVGFAAHAFLFLPSIAAARESAEIASINNGDNSSSNPDSDAAPITTTTLSTRPERRKQQTAEEKPRARPKAKAADEDENEDEDTRTTLLPFDPATASLADTLRWNLGLWRPEAGLRSPRIRVLAARTAAAAGFGGLSLAVRVWSAVEGADLAGASAWAGVWSGAGLVTAGWYAWVGDVV
ncbi:MAG: hypothetical protein Q9165_003310 [Trypethelium subeluteriae]